MNSIKILKVISLTFPSLLGERKKTNCTFKENSNGKVHSSKSYAFQVIFATTGSIQDTFLSQMFSG